MEYRGYRLDCVSSLSGVGLSRQSTSHCLLSAKRRRTDTTSRLSLSQAVSNTSDDERGRDQLTPVKRLRPGPFGGSQSCLLATHSTSTTSSRNAHQESRQSSGQSTARTRLEPTISNPRQRSGTSARDEPSDIARRSRSVQESRQQREGFHRRLK